MNAVNPILAPYVDASEPSAEEFRRLIHEMEGAVRGEFTEEEIEFFEEQSRGPRFRFITLGALEAVLCRPLESLSVYRTGSRPISQDTMLLLRLVHEKVTAHPEEARQAFLDYQKRYKGITL